MRRSKRLFLLLIALCVFLAGCAQKTDTTEERTWTTRPELPEKLEIGAEGIPVLKVYDVAAGTIESMDVEEYVTGVVAGEMKNDWPIEALKAQAILARTFVLKFCESKQSRYKGADISTSVEEAQAYAPENINDQVRKAIDETRGIVMSAKGEYPYAWFFAHAGGMTELPSVALDYNEGDPEYLSAVKSPDSEKAPENVKRWTAEFTLEEVRQAAAETGAKVEQINSIEAGEKGASGRLKTLVINGQKVSAPSFRIAIGANKLKSTLIDKIETTGEAVIFSGSGFGHGVGMSQWGAYRLAEEGKAAEEIVEYYFKGVDLVKMW